VKHWTLSDGAVVLAISAAFLYCTGAAYTGGLLATLRLDSNVLDTGIYPLMYKGFIRNLTSFMNFFLYGASLVFICLCLRWGILDYVKSKRRYSYKLGIIFRFFRIKIYALKKSYAGFEKLVGYPVFLFFIAVCIALYMRGHEKDGAEKAKAIKSSIDDGTYDKVYYKSKEYALIYCGSRNCVGYDLENDRLFYFPQTGYSVKLWKKAPAPAAEPPVHPEREAVEG